jgi:Transglycosylase SLT domain
MELILALLLNNVAPTSVPAEKLAPAILELSNEYGVDPVLVTRIIVVESKGIEKAFNKHTQDYGLMQINVHTANSLEISRTCLMNWHCNLEYGIKILSSFKRVCRYNVGTAALEGMKLKRCLQYEHKLARVN